MGEEGCVWYKDEEMGRGEWMGTGVGRMGVGRRV